MDKKDVQLAILEDIKKTYLIEEDEDGSNLSYIDLLTSYAFDEFVSITGSERIDEKHLYMVFHVVSRRYVRRGDEAKKSVKVGNITETYGEDDTGYERFMHIIERDYNLGGATGQGVTVSVY